MARDRRSSWASPRLLLAILLGPLCGCALFGVDPQQQIRAAVAELRVAEFAFEPDVAFSRDPDSVCLDFSCAEVDVRESRRTIVIAPEAFVTPDRLRATLLEVWSRYLEPRPRSARDRARAALLVLRDGPRVGVRDRYLLRDAFRAYRRLFDGLEAAERADLADPDTLFYP